MKRRQTLEHRFVETIPGVVDDGILFISLKYGIVRHKCCCGCGSEVVTPLSPEKWTIIFDGQAISLWPSIGLWGLPCQSHYWIERNSVRWAGQWSVEEIRSSRALDNQARNVSLARKTARPSHQKLEPVGKAFSLWLRIQNLWK